MCKTKTKIITLVAALVVSIFSLHAEEYAYGFKLSCGMDFTYNSPTELTEEQRMIILHQLDQTFCGDESGETIDPLP